MRLIDSMNKKGVITVFVQDVPMLKTDGVEIVTCELQEEYWIGICVMSTSNLMIRPAKTKTGYSRNLLTTRGI